MENSIPLPGPAILAPLWIVCGIAFYRQDIDCDTFLNYLALGLLIFVVITLFCGIAAIHDLSYEIAEKREHPHQTKSTPQAG